MDARTRSQIRQKAVFLEDLARTGNVSLAVQACTVCRRTLETWRKNDPEFAEAWEDAVDTATELLEGEARRRAFEGWDEPVFRQEKQVGVIRKYSDILLIFLLKALKPNKYRDQATLEHTGQGLVFRIDLTPPPLPDQITNGASRVEVLEDDGQKPVD